MVQHALKFMLTHVIWKARRLLTEESDTPDASLRELVRDQQRVLVDQVTEFALGTRSNTGESVKQEVRR
jgi:cohesin complex subunit SA-1/2